MILQRRFQITKKLAAGGFGQVYVANDLSVPRVVAIKVEPLNVRQSPMELHVLKKYQGRVHSAKLFGAGSENDMNFIAMQLVGDSLARLQRSCPGFPQRFSWATTISLSTQCIEAIRDLHFSILVWPDFSLMIKEMTEQPPKKTKKKDEKLIKSVDQPTPKKIDEAKGSVLPAKTTDKLITHVRSIPAKETDFVKVDETIQERFKILCKLRDGDFGQICKALDKTSKTEIAVKVEKIVENESNPETTVLSKFQDCKNCSRFYGLGTIGKCSFIAMQLLGKNLNELRLGCKLKPQRFSAGTAYRLIFARSSSCRSVAHFGFYSSRHQICNLRKQRAVAGFRDTFQYCSLDAHRRQDLGRKDDLISCFYMMVEFRNGRLPWSDARNPREVQQSKILHPLDSLLPELEMQKIGTHLNNLRFAYKPAYEMILDALGKLKIDKDVNPHDAWDWDNNFANADKEDLYWSCS